MADDVTKEEAGVDAAAFRDAMAQVASAVHVVSTAGPAGRGGMTATAVASVSADPPTVLVAIDRSSRTLAAILVNETFCINTLAASDEDLARIFSGRAGIEGDARFHPGRWEVGATGAPVLRSAIAVFDCRLVAVHEIRTHRLLIGEVAAVGGTRAGAGLIYRGRRYGRF